MNRSAHPRGVHSTTSSGRSVHDLLNEDRRKAIELILEEGAEARDPEDRDGNSPDLESPR